MHRGQSNLASLRIWSCWMGIRCRTLGTSIGCARSSCEEGYSIGECWTKCLRRKRSTREGTEAKQPDQVGKKLFDRDSGFARRVEKGQGYNLCGNRVTHRFDCHFHIQCCPERSLMAFDGGECHHLFQSW